MRYVVGFMRDKSDHVLLLRKINPKWQRGWLNGVGGKIEEGEAPLAAMVREWREEVGNDCDTWTPFCILRGGDYEVHFFSAFYDGMLEDCLSGRKANDVGETFHIINLSTARAYNVIPNLKWLLPLAFSDPSQPYAEVVDVGIVTEAQHVGR